MRSGSSLSERLRGLRIDLGVRQAEVADAVGISRSYLAGVESGADRPGRELLVALTSYYGVSLDWLTTGLGDPKGGYSPREDELIINFRTLNAEEQDIVFRLCAVLRRRRRLPSEGN
jgi:transcriptional regulator with XRE-family HTH domain